MLRELDNSCYLQFFHITYTIIKKYYPGEPVNIHIWLLINITQDKNWFITIKKGKGTLPLFFSNIEWEITFYDLIADEFWIIVAWKYYRDGIIFHIFDISTDNQICIWYNFIF